MIKLDLKNLNELGIYDLFVVDFDGTIVDSMEMWRYICPNFLKYKNVKTEDDVLSLVSSLTNKEIAKMMQKRYFPDNSVLEVTTEFFEYIKMEYVNQKVKPGAIKLLEEINKIGKVVLYSATAKYLVETLVDICHLRPYFSEIYSGSDLGLSKRDGTGYLEIIKLCGNYQKPLILEDAPHAIIGASSQGLDVLAIKDFSNLSHPEIVESNSKYYLDLY